VPQDPAAIARQIEDTRVELAETIDAIAELVSPRRVAQRAGEQARARIAELLARVGHHGDPELTAAEAPGADVARPVVSGSPRHRGNTRVVRWDRVALAVGVTMVLVGTTRRRRRRRR
jgi:hypothetical protein